MLFASCHGGVSPRSAHGVRIQFVKLLGTRYLNEEACTSVRVSGLIVQLLMHDTMHTSPTCLDVDLCRTAPSKSNLRGEKGQNPCCESPTSGHDTPLGPCSTPPKHTLKPSIHTFPGVLHGPVGLCCKTTLLAILENAPPRRIATCGALVPSHCRVTDPTDQGAQ